MHKDGHALAGSRRLLADAITGQWPLIIERCIWGKPYLPRVRDGVYSFPSGLQSKSQVRIFLACKLNTPISRGIGVDLHLWEMDLNSHFKMVLSLKCKYQMSVKMSVFTGGPLSKWGWRELLGSHITPEHVLLVTSVQQAPSYPIHGNGIGLNFLDIGNYPSSYPPNPSWIPCVGFFRVKMRPSLHLCCTPWERKRKWKVTCMEYLPSPKPWGRSIYPGR